MKYSCEITVEGQVQHVGFRYYSRMKALELQLTGYVRNSRDGSVLVVAEGEEPELMTLVDYLKIGPPMARVRNVLVSKAPYEGIFSEFSIRF